MANLDERKKEIANLISKAQEAVEKGDLETCLLYTSPSPRD